MLLSQTNEKKRNNRGFTLIELLVVIAIIGLLSSIVLTSLGSARTRARDAQRQGNVRQIMTALELYHGDNGRYPRSGGASSPNSGWDNSGDSSWNNLITDLQPYIARLPGDPLNAGSGWAGNGSFKLNYFARGYGCDGQWYMIVYRLENSGSATSPGASACSRNFNYGGTITIGNRAQ